ncbi:MAG: carbohydrate ABC transporter permease [Mariniblastus sp.]|nr:carbohydrate ABC transporter permease [Mariniblastus sp.]
MKRQRAKKSLMYLLVWFTVALFSLPLLVMVSGSLKTSGQLTRDPYGLWPDGWNWGNYPEALASLPFLVYLSNTLLLCAGCVIGTTLSCALAAYGLSRVNWSGRRWMFGLVIATMLLPWHITMIPRFVLISELGLYNSLWAIVLPTFLGDAFFIFLLRQFFMTIPESLLDAGRMDGLSPWGLFWKVVIPLSKPALATVALFQFVTTWNDFGGPLLYLSDPQKFPLAYGLERFVSAYGDQTNLLLAAATLFTLPMILIFFLAQKTFIQGISTTGIKG